MSAAPRAARIEVPQVPDCPLVGRVREMVQRVLAQEGVAADVTEMVGGYASPTLLVDGRDVTGRPAGECAACRLDLPTERQLLAALGRGPRANPRSW